MTHKEHFHNHITKSKPLPRVLRFIGLVIGGVILAGAFALVFGYIVMLLWNWIMPVVFGITTITFWQAFGIILLAKIIFSSFGPHPHKKDDKKEKYFRSWVHHGVPPWRTKDSCGNNKWKYYHEFWEEKGKSAYDEYVKEKKEKTEKTEDDRMNEA